MERQRQTGDLCGFMGVQHVKPLAVALLAPVLLLPALGLQALLPASAGSLPACSAAVQHKAEQALAALEQRQQAADAQRRSHPTATDMTMNGPVLRELEKRHEREALVDTLTAKAAKQQHCALNVPEP